MIRHSLVVGVDDLATYDGAVVCRDVTVDLPTGSRTIRRGTPVDAPLRSQLALRPGVRVDVLYPDPGDVEQPEVSRRVANLLVGEGVTSEPPHQGQVIVRAARAGVARIRGETVRRLNATESVLVATALDGRVVKPAETIVVIKAARLWVSAEDTAIALAVVDKPATVRVAGFRAQRAAFIAGPRTRVGNIETAAANLGRALGRFGTRLVDTRQISDDPDTIKSTYRQQVDAGVEIILIAGSIVLDPGDPFLVALEAAGGRTTCLGAPVDPGTMFWVGYLDRTVLMGLASCEMYGRLSVLDLILPYAAAGERVDSGLLAELGYGGLLDQTFTARQSAL